MLFSDIVGFTAICATTTPMMVINMLQNLYEQFDLYCGQLDVYKVRSLTQLTHTHICYSLRSVYSTLIFIELLSYRTLYIFSSLQLINCTEKIFSPSVKRDKSPFVM